MGVGLWNKTDGCSEEEVVGLLDLTKEDVQSRKNLHLFFV